MKKPRSRLSVALIVAATSGAVLWFMWPRARTGLDPTTAPATSASDSAPPRTSKTTPKLPGSGAAAPGPTSEPGSDTVFTARWGGGLDELGHERLDEGNAAGPMSFAVDGKGRTLVLDSVNGRIVRRGVDGKAEVAIPIDLRVPQDLATAPDGSMVVLDRFSNKEVAIYDESGQLMGSLPVEGENVPDPGEVTGVFVDGKDVYVEREHGTLVKIGDTGGLPAEPRSEIPGRPSRDGLSFLSAGIIEAGAGRVYVSSIERATNEHRFTRELRLRTVVRAIVLLDSDKSGTIYFAAEVEEAGGQGAILLSCLEPLKGVIVGSAVLPTNTLPEESFRDLVVLDEGGVMHALRSEEGVTYRRYDCK